MRRIICCAICAACLVLSCLAGSAADSMSWDTHKDRVSANIDSLPVLHVLEAVAKKTGWEVFIEANTTHTVSTKFQNLSGGEALRMLLGNLNFAIVPQTNGPAHLYVFRTTMGNATRRIRASDLISSAKHSGKIPNELILTLRPGAKIDGVDCISGANVTGRISALNAYRVQFTNAAAADAARNCLAGNTNVLSVESNYAMDPPDSAQAVLNNASQLNLDPKPPDNNNCQVVVGLVDTQVQDLGKNLDQFLMPSVSVAGNAPADSQLTHGTAMAETILQGIQSNTGGKTSVKILPIDVYGGNETTSTFDVAQGIDAAVAGGANVVNLSLGGTGDSPFLQTLIQNSEKQGIVFFAAAGNEPVTTPFYPAAYPGVQAVTADSAPGQIADYANRGSFVDLMLPGTSIVPFDGQSWAVAGTSTATAFASGITAGLADANNDCPGQVVPTLQSKYGVKFTGGQ